MSLADWLASGADPAKMTPDEVRRRQQLCSVREEQAASRLEAILAERDEIFRRGALTHSAPLRRVFARRWTRLDGDARALERELARIGKEATGLSVLRQTLKDGVALTAVGDCTPLLALLDDASAPEEEFAVRLATSVTGGVTASRSDLKTGPVSLGNSVVLAMWSRLDGGEFASPDEALRRLDDR